jgi:hypothetical protein
MRALPPPFDLEIALRQGWGRGCSIEAHPRSTSVVSLQQGANPGEEDAAYARACLLCFSYQPMTAMFPYASPCLHQSRPAHHASILAMEDTAIVAADLSECNKPPNHAPCVLGVVSDQDV